MGIGNLAFDESHGATTSNDFSGLGTVHNKYPMLDLADS